MTRLIYRAWTRDAGQIHTGEALLLACLMHAKGRGRGSKDMTDVRKIMRDINMEDKRTKDRK